MEAKLNTSLVINIENNVQKAPTVWAEEATERIMDFLLFTSTSADPFVREQAMAFKVKIEKQIFDVIEDITRKAITAERMKLGG